MASKSKINWYAKYATEHLVTKQDESGFYCEVLSENVEGVSYRVDMDEQTMQAKSCRCPSYKPCKHMRIATEALAPVTPVEPKITEIEPNAWYVVNSDSQVWRDAETGQWLAAGLTENAIEIVESYLAVKAAEQIVATPSVAQPATPVVELTESVEQTIAPVRIAVSDSKKLATVLSEQKVDWGLVGHLNGNRGFQMMR